MPESWAALVEVESALVDVVPARSSESEQPVMPIDVPINNMAMMGPCLRLQNELGPRIGGSG